VDKQIWREDWGTSCSSSLSASTLWTRAVLKGRVGRDPGVLKSGRGRGELEVKWGGRIGLGVAGGVADASCSGKTDACRGHRSRPQGVDVD
jgi:hypothetical protein